MGEKEEGLNIHQGMKWKEEEIMEDLKKHGQSWRRMLEIFKRDRIAEDRWWWKVFFEALCISWDAMKHVD